MGKQSGVVWKGLLLAVVLLLTACDSQKQPAQAAYARIEASVAPVREDLEKYAPADYEQLNALMDQMKTRLNGKDYQGALDIQPQIMSQLMLASGAAAKKKNELATSLVNDWRQLATTVPRMINQVTARLNDLKEMTRLPSNVARDAVQRVQASLPELTADWKAAMDASRRNDVATAVSTAQSIKKRCGVFAASLGTKLSE